MTRIGQFAAATMFSLAAIGAPAAVSAATKTITISADPASGSYVPVAGGTSFILTFLLSQPLTIASGDVINVTGNLKDAFTGLPSALTVPLGTGEVFLTALPSVPFGVPPSGNLSSSTFTINGMTQASTCQACLLAGELDLSTSNTPFSFTNFSSSMTLGTLTSSGPVTGPFTITAYTLSFTTLAPAVPEPATWAMMILGFGAVGGAIRYLRRKTTVSYA